MPKQPNDTPGKKPTARPVWLLLGPAAACGNDAYGSRPHDKQTVPQGSGAPPSAAAQLLLRRLKLIRLTLF